MSSSSQSSPFGFSRRVLSNGSSRTSDDKKILERKWIIRRLYSTRRGIALILVLSLILIIIKLNNHHQIISSSSSSSSLTSMISSHPLPVHHDPALIDFRNNPISIHRPNPFQFSSTSSSTTTTNPTIAIITATQNTRHLILQTYKSLFHQSIQNWQWIIINDHTDNQESLNLLQQIDKDPRVTILINNNNPGLANSRNIGFDYILNKQIIPPYLTCLDDDDLFELTALEKSIWMLESNKQEWDMIGFPFVKFSSQNTTEFRGFHSGKENYDVGNFIVNSAVFKSKVLIESGCRYNAVDFPVGGEDWDLWMCFAAAGFWGGQMPELLYWYRVNPNAFRESRWGNMFVDGFGALHKKIKTLHPSLATVPFPIVPPRGSNQLEHIHYDLPYESLLSTQGKAIMFVIPWLYVGGADIGAMRMIQLYVESGYRVTVVCTLYKNPEGLELRPYILQLTHDVHVLPAFLRVNDFPRYMKHLILSRGIDEVIISNSQWMYEALPSLAEQLPKVKFIDYLHNEAYDGWKSGGYPIYSIISQRYLARTITCSSYLRRWVIERGHAADRIGVVKLGLELDDFTITSQNDRNRAKRDLLDVNPGTIVVTVVARLDPQKRSTLVPLIASELRSLGARNFLINLIGDGPLEGAVQARIKVLQVKDEVRLLGTIATPQDYLAASDIFLLPSVSEGISIAVAEAMAMGLPVVTARAGALPEQLGDDSNPALASSSSTIKPLLAGILVNHTMIDSIDARLYAHELFTLMRSSTLRTSYGEVGLALTSKMGWRTTLMGLFREVKKSKNLDMRDLDHLRTLPNPSAFLSAQTLVMQARVETDLAAHYPH